MNLRPSKILWLTVYGAWYCIDFPYTQVTGYSEYWALSESCTNYWMLVLYLAPTESSATKCGGHSTDKVPSEFALLPFAWMRQRKIKFSQSNRLWARQTQTSLWGGRNTEKGTFQEARLLFVDPGKSLLSCICFLLVRKEAWAQVSQSESLLHILRHRDSTSFQIRMSQAIYTIYV